ncbi:hypothetical protein, partial [Methanosarcina mazei]
MKKIVYFCDVKNMVNYSLQFHRHISTKYLMIINFTTLAIFYNFKRRKIMKFKQICILALILASSIFVAFASEEGGLI